MADRGPWFTLFIVAVSLLVAPRALETGEQHVERFEAAPPADKAPALSRDVKPEAWDQFLCSYFHPRRDNRHCPEAGSVTLPLPVEYLIAGVPDPEATSIPATFDTMVEALLGAAATDGWTYDRNWIPWGKDEKRPHPTAEAPLLTNENPGLLLFRKSDRLLLVFLVGETPTSGVSKTALDRAARFILARSAEPAALRILGPRFSGSVPSYGQAIKQLASVPGYAGVRFVTGSATRAANRGDIEKLGDRSRPATYEGAVEHDARTLDLFLRWLQSRGIARHEVAMLAEGGTAFGAALRTAPTAAQQSVLRIEFPYQISRLRNAYDKDPELRALWLGTAGGAKSATAALAKESQLAWSLKTEREDTDRVRTFQGQQTTLVQERQVEQLVETVKQHGVRAVGVNATDLLDTVFITLLLRRHCPDVRVFTLDSDLLFTYSSGALSFHGMLLVSPYALWSPPHEHEADGHPLNMKTFANRSALGVHNAFMRLMNGTGFEQYNAPDGRTPPGIWLTSVGLGRIWPIAVFGLQDRSTSQMPEIAHLRTPKARWALRPDATYWLIFGLFAALIGYGAVVYVARRVAERGWLGSGFDPAFYFLFEPPDASPWRTGWTQVMCAFGFIAVLPFTAAYGWPLPLTLLAVFTAAALADRRRAATWITAAVLAVFSAALTTFWFNYHAGAMDSVLIERGERFFFGYRLLHPVSGLSPLPPWLLAWFGCAWWAVMRLNQLRTRELRSPQLESWPAGEPLLSGLPLIAQQASRIADAPFSWRGFGLVLTALLPLFTWNLPRGLWSLEAETATWFTWTNGVYIAFLLLVTLVLVTLMQLYQTHATVMALLNSLVDHPLGDAFERLPKDLAPSQLWLRGNNRTPFQTCLQGLKRLRQLATGGFPGAPDFAAMIRIEAQLGQLSATVGARRRLTAADVTELQREFNTAAAALYPAVIAGWHTKPQHALHNAAEETLALRLAALVRYLVMQMRAMIEYLSLAVIALILAIVSYPFEPASGLVNIAAILAAACGLTVVRAITQLDRHPVMQKFASLKEAPSFLDTLRKVGAFGLAPFVAALSALFPGSARSLIVWVEAAGKYLGR